MANRDGPQRERSSPRESAPGTEAPDHQGLIPLLTSLCLGPLLAVQFVDAMGSSEEGSLVVLAGGLLSWAGWGLARLMRSLRKRAMARHHVDEPWLWDRDWPLETEADDHRLSALAWPLLPFALAALFTCGFLSESVHGLFGERRGDARSLFLGLAWVASGTGGLLLWKHFARLRRRWRGRRHFGAVTLRLPEVPLAMGKTARLEVLFSRDVPEISLMSVTLERIRAKTTTVQHRDEARIRTHRTSEYTRTRHVHAERLGPAHPLELLLSIPEQEPAASTWKRGDTEVYWELRLEGRSRGRVLDVRFPLPVYFVRVGQDAVAEAPVFAQVR
ncbi:hypothetical protein LZ198_16880 [Myxococcus sp. K15C18031901]|uniref:hypothetical protein n=1 Tax=Myxococcus dinghuensis TaxID=2906761 RepID=UPI0020A745BC|nr:hypothetical protein [Myxococcus dinghuensis]MCP3100546.1 hypothetical protein [Myxococcus dinghuensis]